MATQTTNSLHEQAANTTEEESVTEVSYTLSEQVATVVPAFLKTKKDDLLVVTRQLHARLSALLKDDKVRVVSLSGAGGALTLGAVGSGCGLAAGSTVGFAVGVVPSLLTFGLSIPVCSVAGGVVGTGAGAVMGGSTGLVGGGVFGSVAYAYRVEIKDGVTRINAKIVDIASEAKTRSGVVCTRAVAAKNRARAAVMSCIRSLDENARKKASDLNTRTRQVVSNKQFQVSTVSAASGATVCGIGGAGVGVSTGTVVGAAIGVVPAIFTFGLSIPVGAFLGGSAGLCLGAAAGATTGLVGGGAIGYGGYAKRQELSDAKDSIYKQAHGSVSFVHAKAKASVSYVKTHMPGTGGTD